MIISSFYSLGADPFVVDLLPSMSISYVAAATITVYSVCTVYYEDPFNFEQKL
jgi:hypothetical protein